MKRFYPLLPLLFMGCMGATMLAQQPPAPTRPASFGSVTSDAAKQPSATPELQAQNPTAQDAPDPLFDMPPMPKGKITLVGGRVKKIDRIRNKLVVQAFGGSTMKMRFDERTHIYRDGVETTHLGIRRGDRVYVDTMLDGTHVFARNIRVQTGATAADSRGQVLAFDPQDGVVTLQDSLSRQPVRFHLEPQTSITREQQPVSPSELKPGALVTVTFAPDGGKHVVAKQVSIIATPGMSFIFAGPVSYLDLSSGLLSVDNQTDRKIYDINFSPAATPVGDDLRIGLQVVVNAIFTGSGYRADRISVLQTAREQSAADEP